MSCLRTTEFFDGPIGGRPSGILARGDVIHGHRHNFAHTTILFGGAVRVKFNLPDGTSREHEYKQPMDRWTTYAEVEHEITALEDNTQVLCLFVHREPDGTIVDYPTGWRAAHV